MFDTCATCENETETMFINGLVLCYECATLTEDPEAITDTEEETL